MGKVSKSSCKGRNPYRSWIHVSRKKAMPESGAGARRHAVAKTALTGRVGLYLINVGGLLLSLFLF